MDTTLLIPAYNVEGYLPALFDRVEKQTTPFAEVIVYDDASADETAAVAEAHGAHVLRGTTNRGPAYARNSLLEAAETDLVHLHDADDTYLDPKFVEVTSSLADLKTAVVCRWEMVHKDGTARTFTYEDVDDWTRFLINEYAHLNAVVYPRAFLVEHGGFDDDLIQCDELLMNAKMAAFGLGFRYTDAVSARHERREGSLIDDLEPAEPHEWAIRMCERLLDTLSEEYHETVGKKALYHTVALQRAQADSGWIERGTAVVRRAGIRKIRGHGRITHWISALFGMKRAIGHIARNAS